ncbi:MAG: phage tail tape measure protein, partial [Lachnospiraceae bacterium]|nr:phage tail tape measure protein [Lachnospiraceae bacterium]
MSNSESNFRIMLQAMLDKVKSIANIKSDIKAIEPKLPKVKIQGKLDKTATQKELNSKIKTIKPKVKVDADTTQAEKKIKKIGEQKNKTTITPTVDNTQAVSGLKQVQKKTKTLWERFTANIFGSNLIRMGTQKVIQAVHEALRSIKELDTIKTDIQMVSGTSDSDVNAMMSSYNAMAKTLSSTTKDVAEAANEFLRMGESIQNTNELIRSSQILSKVGMIESADAASYLISSLKGYKVAAEDSLDIVSKLTSVDLEAAVSAGGLSEALSKCANIASNSGVTMDRLIGYTATVGETTQKSMSEVGNSFQALLSRMNNIKIGRLIDDETGESLSDTEAVLNKLGIRLRDTENTYRSFDDVLDDVGSRWESFTKVEQNALSVAIAGTRQRENFEALMNNWGNALKYSETAANSAGSALERYGVYQDSIEAKTNELTAALESLSTNTISEDLYSGIIEATTGIVEFLDKANLLKASLTGLVAMGVTKAIASIGAGFITAAKSTVQLSAAMALFDRGLGADNLRDIGLACKGLNNNQLKLILSTKGLKTEQRLSILEGMGLEEQERKQMLTTLGFAAAEDKATVSTFLLKGAFRALGTAIAVNPIGAIVTTVTIATMVFTGFNKAMEEVRQKAKELGDSFKSTKSDIESYKSQIEDLHKTINDSNSSIEDVTNARQTLMSVQNDLIDKFGTEKETIDLITSAINDQSDALDTLVGKQWQAAKNEFNDVGFWGGIGNWLGGYKDNIERMADEMEDVSFSFYIEGINRDINGNYRENNDLIRALEDAGFAYDVYWEQLKVSGGLQAVYDDILKIQRIAKDYDAPESFLNSLTKAANKAKETLDSYGEMWDNYILNERIFENENLADSWHKVNEAYSDYHDAIVSGNQEEIERSLANYSDLMSNVLNDSDVDESVKEYFRDMYPALQAEAEKWEFHAKILPEYDTHALNGMTKADILNMLQTDELQYGEQTFNSILNMASDYGIITGDNAEKVQQLLDLLVLWGILQDNINESTAEYTPDANISVSDTITQLNTRLKPTFDSLKSAYNDIFTDDGGFALDSIDILSTCDSIKSKLDELNEIEGITVDYSSYVDFVRVLGSTESTEQDVEGAFNSLAASITQTALTGKEDFATMKAALEDLGVANNEIVAFDVLIKNTEALKKAGLDLANATDAQITAFANETVAAENVSQAIQMLSFQKQLCRLQDMNTADEITNLRTLAENAGYTGQIIRYLTELEKIYQGVANGTMNQNLIDAKLKRAETLQTLIAEAASKVDYKPFEKSAAKAGASAGKAAGESFEDALKDELSSLNSVVSYIGDVIGDQIDLFQEQKDAAIKALEAEKEAAEEALEAEKELIQGKIDAKQAEIDAIEEAAEARKDELDLQKAQYELERMQNQRTILQYSESKGMHYVTDTKELREAKEAATEAEENIRTAGMEKEISGLNDAMDILDRKIEESGKYYDSLIDQAEKYWDSLIKGLEDYKLRWQELTEIEEQAKMETALRNLGITTDNILSMSESAFQSFKGTYLGLLNEMYSGNDGMINMLREFGGIPADALSALSGTFSDAADSLDRFAGRTGTAAAAVQSVSGALNEVAGADISSPIGQFDALGSSVDNTAASISGGTAPKAGVSGGFAGKDTPNAKYSSGSGSGSLVSSIEKAGETTAEVLGELDGDGAIGSFGRMGGVIAEAGSHVEGIIDGLNELDGMAAECTIVVNVETRGGVPAYAEGTAVSDVAGSIDLDSSRHKAEYSGSAHVTGTANVVGNWGVSNPGRSLVGELGQELWIHAKDGRFETVGDHGAEFINTEKGDIIFNHLQTQELLKRGRLSGRGKIFNGKAYINGINDVFVTPDGNVLTPPQPGDCTWDLQQKFKPLVDRILNGQTDIASSAMFEHQKQMEQMIKNISYSNVVTNIANSRNIQPVVNNTFHVTMLMYGKEASNRKQEIDRQHHTIPNQRPKDKHR